MRSRQIQFLPSAIVLAALTAFAFPSAKPGPPPATAGIHFEDVTHSAGIHFTHNTGAFGKKYLPETMGPGAAFIDYDNDGWQDIFLVNGMDWPGHGQHHSVPALYHNNHDGTFTDVTSKVRPRRADVWHGRCRRRLQ